ncbi:hypothetical protein QTI66_32740 [Variovorax sp. J22R133]|uniref:hypothetical protein n=1 Tax=Variovorax brevis TaxID=3053503 RepID=UPI002576846E|nr:hypothetical protein [Variovorax sp. J22R133]MDM0116896.1 hypothetical protein [Variovorax sp. J22R133]
MKLRLFALRDTRTNKPVAELFFSAKPDARKERDARNAQAGGGLVYVITYGPDHRHFK